MCFAVFGFSLVVLIIDEICGGSSLPVAPLLMELLSVITPPRPCGSEALDPFAGCKNGLSQCMPAAADRPSPSGARFEALVSGANGN